MKRLTLLAVPLAFAGFSSLALANDTVTLDELNTLLDSADQHFSHYDDIEVDDSRLEIEGWREDGTKLEMDLQLADGSVSKEEEGRSGDIPDWSLSGDEVRQALEVAQQEGLQRFKEFDADDDGHVDIEGYDDQDREIEIRLNSSDFSVIDVERD
ncbi:MULTISPECIES: PepSY domain-containing protein [Halomonadaceae]|uniref:PepSY domain-containing protein n=1 Tax=Halomonadaceae TaxID=28256 RepID=UPI00159B3479|nr:MULTISPECIES: PepSY domain-containing protein [Halomonas]QJQ93843.1 hypothetical protein HIO72_00070 [Halomonas sp. PA5]